MTAKKLLIVEVAGLGWDLVSRHPPPVRSPVFKRLETIFPAVTCAVQASFRTAALPREHGLVANGVFFRDLRKALFWEQAAALVTGERIWHAFREQGGRVGMMFWQQSLGESVDLILSPAPIHKHGGGMIHDCHAQPADLYERLVNVIGRPFRLQHYWGPMASKKSTAWIVAAVEAVLQMPAVAPDLLLAYLPHLDYDLQRYGPQSMAAARAIEWTYGCLERLRVSAAARGYETLFFGDYAVETVGGEAVFPNRRLREAGLFQARLVRGRAYADLFSSAAFAMVDHQIAHVYTRSDHDTCRARETLARLPGVATILDRKAQASSGIDHARSGELVLIAEPGRWFAYPWWRRRGEAPDYATHVDIHNKPGYDPCELFWGWPPPSVSRDTARICGSHGRAGPEAAVAWASSCDFPGPIDTLTDLARATRHWLTAADVE